MEQEIESHVWWSTLKRCENVVQYNLIMCKVLDSKIPLSWLKRDFGRVAINYPIE